MANEKNKGLPALRLLAISGSPHATGTSTLMLDCAVSAAKARGWHIDEIHLYDCKINCLGCRTCLKADSCVQDDDIHQIADLLSMLQYFQLLRTGAMSRLS
ncbi:MAG: NAD(P)H-dependent oxidoreductase [Spirochaetia bacterium]|jgi:multimeric flavodoxin WrbA|nr:NAD(P)H-dependent oxidoreductase [Spirochaetia bacterium]